MAIHYIERRPTEAAVVAIDAELATAMRKLGATPEEMILVDAEHPDQAYETLARLGAQPYLLEIVGSFRDTMNDRWVVDKLRRWNSKEPEMTDTTTASVI
jgi:hypothetical protein